MSSTPEADAAPQPPAEVPEGTADAAPQPDVDVTVRPTLRVALLAPLAPAVALAVILAFVPMHIGNQTLSRESIFITTLASTWAVVALVLLLVRDDQIYQIVWTQRRTDHRGFDYEQLWTGSPEFGTYRRRRFLSWLCLAVALVLAVSAVGMATGELTPVARRHGFAAMFVVAAVLLAGYAFVPYASSRRAFLERLQFEKSEEVRKAVADIDLHGTPQFQTLFELNRKQLDAYHVLTMRHAQASFRNAQVAALVGFSVLVAGVVIALQATDTSSRIAVASLSGIATLLSGYISKVFFVSNKQAMKDLADFYKQPLDASKLLAAERLVRDPDLLKDPAGTLVRLMVSSLVLPTGGTAEPGEAAKPNGVASPAP